MNYYDLAQTLEIFQSKLPEKLLPFGIKQLADLCRRGNITPVFSHDKVIIMKENPKDKGTGLTYLMSISVDFKGYLTSPKLIYLFPNNNQLSIATSSAYIYEIINSNEKNDKGSLIHLQTANQNITIDDLLFPNEQIQRYIELVYNSSLSTTEDSRISELETQLNKAKAHIEDLKKSDINYDEAIDKKDINYDAGNEELNPKTLAAVTRLLNVLLYKASYDISSHSGTTNTNIVEFSKKIRTPITKNTVSKWIKEVQQLRINVEKETN